MNTDESIEVNVSSTTNARGCAASVFARLKEGGFLGRFYLCYMGMSAERQAIRAVYELGRMLSGVGKKCQVSVEMDDRPIKERGIVTPVVKTVMLLKLHIYDI